MKTQCPTMSPNLWDSTLKTVLRGKFVVLSAHMRKPANSHIRELTTQLKALEQKEANSPWKSRNQKIIRLRAEINKVETKKTRQTISVTFFKKINKIDKLLPKLTKKQRENMQVNKISIEKGDITADTEEIQRFFRSYFENLYLTKFENLMKMNKFLDRYHQN